MQPSLKDIFEKHYAPLCNYASSIINDKHAAENVVQSIFVQLWEKDKIRSLEQPGPYLLRCVKYKCIDHLRSPKLKQEVSMDKLPEIASMQTSTIGAEDIIHL